MKTVQEVLRTINREHLLWAYLDYAPLTIDVCDKEDIDSLSLGEIKENYRRDFSNFLGWLCAATPRPDEDGRIGIIFGYPTPDLKVEHDLVFVDELHDHGEKAFGMAYDMNDWEETLGYYVADTKYTHKKLCEVMAQVLYEMKVYGNTPEEVVEGREQVLTQLEESLSNLPHAEEGEDRPDDYEIIEEFDAERKKALENPVSLPEGKRLELQYHDIVNDYAAYLRGREIKIIMGQQGNKQGRRRSSR